MKVEGAIEKFALAVAIGSLFLLSGFLIVDATTDGFLAEFEKYSKSPAWAVVAAVPAITLAYILGAFIQVISDEIVRKISPSAQLEEWQALESLARSKNEILASQYEELRRSKKLLEGCLAPLLILAIGIFLEKKNLPKFTYLLMGCAAAVGSVACFIPLITSRLHKSLVHIGEIAASLAQQRQDSSKNA